MANDHSRSKIRPLHTKGMARRPLNLAVGRYTEEEDGENLKSIVATLATL